MPAKALLIPKPRNPQHHRVGKLTIGKKRQCRRLAAQLIFGVVQIGQKLNFGHRDKTVMRHADGKAQNRLLVQQCVDHPAGAKAGMQLLRHAVNATFAPDIFAHHHDLGVLQHQIGQRPIDNAAHGLKIGHLVKITAKSRRSGLGCWAVAGMVRAMWWHNAGHDIGC